MNVVLEDFQREVGPLEHQSWERTSVKEFAFLRGVGGAAEVK